MEIYRQFSVRGYIPLRFDMIEQLPRVFGDYYPLFSMNYPPYGEAQAPTVESVPVPDGPSLEEILEYAQQLKAAQAAQRANAAVIETMELLTAGYHTTLGLVGAVILYQTLRNIFQSK